MVSLFGRSRTSSKNTTALPAGPSKSGYDEFGRGQQPSSGEGGGGPWLAAPDEGKAGGGSRKRTLSAPGPPHQLSTYGDLPPVPQHQEAFVPLHIPPKKESDSQEREYGYLSAENEVILSLEDVHRLVRVVGDEILSRALTTPLLFSSQALDVSANRVRSLVRSFLGSCNRPSAPTGDAKWREDARLAGPHELGMVLRWGLARLMRVVNGVYVRGMLEWDVYVQWKTDEEALRFPATHFPVFLEMVSPALRPLLSQLFNIFSRLSAYSAQSGLTPIAISTLFGPLLFGLGPDSIPFSQTYHAYLRSSHATEHLLLSYIRNVEVEARHSASPMPLRLKDWIRGYPVMIPPLRDLEKPRRGCKLVRIVSARKNVRLYSPDLVKTGASWGNEGDIGGRREWQRIGSKTMPPKYSEEFRKRLDIPANYAPSLSSFSNRSSLDYHIGTTSSPPSSMSNARSVSFGLPLDDPSGLATEDLTPKPFKSLTDMQWGEFENLGFSDADTSKLQFDLNEAARANRNTKRTTMSWNDFHDMGFVRDEGSLAETLQFSTPVASTINKTSSPLARFKIGSSKGKQSKVASQYDPDLDFETKTASDSSGGEQSPSVAMLGGDGHGRRHSKDDAWVDILVGSNRRMPDQEATFRNGTRAIAEGTTSPERGYQPPTTTVATAVVRNGSDSLRTPRTSLTRPRSDPELGRDDTAAGYQALVDHRRDQTYGSQTASAIRPVSYDDDISYAESDEEEVMEVPRHSVIDGPQIRVSQSSDGPAPVQHSSRGYSYGDMEDEGDFEPAMSPVSTERGLGEERDSYYTESQELPAPPQLVSPADRVATVEPKPRVAAPRKPGGINSLIEMYAKKDEEAAKAHYEPKASRLPVRSGSNGPASPSNLKAADAPPDRTPSPVDFAPPPPMEDPINRLITPSPGRYVHGAPLHNVLEEDGEETTEEA
ncbi:hypothetical protein FRB90_002136 [Tulasnella sp. 427]|nr:hypothetical protein FRB90_002136 [Tulasnella sp. 427]